MTPITLITVALSAGCYVGGALLPAARVELFSVASALLAWVLPSPAKLLAAAKSP
jgi:hypothetical protein